MLPAIEATGSTRIKVCPGKMISPLTPGMIDPPVELLHVQALRPWLLEEKRLASLVTFL